MDRGLEGRRTGARMKRCERATLQHLDPKPPEVTAPLHLDPTSQPPPPTALLPYCPTALLPYCPTALLPYCPTAYHLLPTRHKLRPKPETLSRTHRYPVNLGDSLAAGREV